MIADPEIYALFLECHRRFNYEDGKLTYRVRVGNGIRAGSIAGKTDKNGYGIVRIGDKFYLLHRLIFLMFKSYLPEYIDHKDNTPSNNRIENLRAATRSENQRNIRLNKNNTSGVKGVVWNKKARKWTAQCQTQGVNKFIGSFTSLTDAELAIRAHRASHHGEFANHGDQHEQ